MLAPLQLAMIAFGLLLLERLDVVSFTAIWLGCMVGGFFMCGLVPHLKPGVRLSWFVTYALFLMAQGSMFFIGFIAAP